MNIEEARKILQTCNLELQKIQDDLELQISPSMAPITTNFFFDQLECAMENIECRDYDLERLTKSELPTTDLEILIDNAYGEYLDKKRAKEHAEAIEVQQAIEEKKEKFTARLLEVIPKNIYELLGIQVSCDSVDSVAGARISYRDVEILIGCSQNQELWNVQVEESPERFNSIRHIQSGRLVKCLLVQMGKIRERASNANGSR